MSLVFGALRAGWVYAQLSFCCECARVLLSGPTEFVERLRSCVARWGCVWNRFLHRSNIWPYESAVYRVLSAKTASNTALGGVRKGRGAVSPRALGRPRRVRLKRALVAWFIRHYALSLDFIDF